MSVSAIILQMYSNLQNTVKLLKCTCT